MPVLRKATPALVLLVGAIAIPALSSSGCHKTDPNDCVADLLIDTENCGACGHACKGSTCTNGSCDAVDLATKQPDPSTLLLVGTSLLWANRGDADANGAAISTCPVDGCPAAGPTVLATPSKIEALTVAHQSILWTDPRGAISSCAYPTCGSPSVVGLFSAGIGTPPAPVGTLSQIVADDTSFVFSSVDPQAGVIASCPIAGCTPTNADATVVAGSQPDVAPIAMTADTIFWASDGVVRSCARAGCTKPTDLASGQTRLGAFAIDGSTLFWGTASATTPNHVRSIPVAGGAVTDVALAERAVGGVAIDGDFVYWTEPDGGTLKRAPKAGGDAKTFLTGEAAPTAIVVSNGWVYWLARGTDGLKHVDGALRKVVTP